MWFGIYRDLFTHVHTIYLMQFWLLLVKLFPNCTPMCVITYTNQVAISDENL